MSLRTFALLVVLALLGGAAFLLFARAGRTPRAAVPAPAVGETEATREHAELAPAERPAPDAIALESGATPTRTESTSEPVEAARATDDAERDTLLVEVLDVDGRPAAGVQLSATMHVREAATVAAARTGDDGRATLAHIGHWFAEADPQGLRLAARLPFQPPAETLVERAPPPGVPVRMRLPALGAIEVDVRAADGTAAADGTMVQLSVARPEDEPSAAMDAEERGTTHDGHATFGWVPLGQRFELSATNDSAHARVWLAGPRTAGERVAARVQLVVDTTVLHLRAVDTADAPVSEALFVELRADDGEALSNDTIVSNDDGRFEVALRAPGLRRTRRLEVQVPVRVLAGAVELPDPLPLGDVELGDLVLAPAPRIAEGRVIDEDGRPVARATVEWTPVVEHDGDFDFASPLCATDADGRFSLGGSTPAEHVTLYAVQRGLVADPVEVAVGARGVEIVMHVAGGVVGSVLLDPDVSPDRVDLALSSATGEPVATENVMLDGTFAFWHLRAGSYDLTAQVESRPMVEVRGMTVVPGEVTLDPRLRPLDLRGKVHVFELELVPPAPGFRIAGRVLYGTAGTGVLDQGFLLGSNHVRLVSASAALDAELRVEGCRIERLAALAPHTRVELRAGFPVRLVLRPEVSLPASPVRLGAALSIRGDWSSQGARFFDEHGEVVLFAAEPGELTLGWFVERGTRLDSGIEVLELPTEVVRVVERGDEQRIELALTNAALRAALDAADAR